MTPVEVVNGDARVRALQKLVVVQTAFGQPEFTFPGVEGVHPDDLEKFLAPAIEAVRNHPHYGPYVKGCVPDLRARSVLIRFIHHIPDEVITQLLSDVVEEIAQVYAPSS